MSRADYGALQAQIDELKRQVEELDARLVASAALIATLMDRTGVPAYEKQRKRANA